MGDIGEARMRYDVLPERGPSRSDVRAATVPDPFPTPTPEPGPVPEPVPDPGPGPRPLPDPLHGDPST